MPSLDEVIENMTEMREVQNDLDARQKRDQLVLYGDKEVHIKGLIDRIEFLENVAKNINGMPDQVNALDEKFDEFIDTDKKRLWMIRGIGIGLGIQLTQSTGLWAVLVKVLS